MLRSAKVGSRGIPINIFLRAHNLRHLSFFVGIDVISQWKLHNNSTNSLIHIQLLDGGDDSVDACVSRKVNMRGLDTDLRSCLELHADIDRRIRTRPNLEDGKVRCEARKRGTTSSDTLCDGLAKRSDAWIENIRETEIGPADL